MRAVLTTPRRESYREVSQTLHGRRSMLWALVTLVSVALFGAADEARAQAVRDTAVERKHQDDCRLAHQVLTTGQPAVKRDWALGVIGTCGEEGAEAIAAVLRLHRSATRRTEELDALVYQASTLIAQEIFSTALDIAADPSAGRIARIEALRIIASQAEPRTFVGFEQFIEPGGGLTIPIADFPLTVVEPLGEGVVDRARNRLSNLLEEPSLDGDLRQAVRNALDALAEG